jgi:hypothetical protein
LKIHDGGIAFDFFRWLGYVHLLVAHQGSAGYRNGDLKAPSKALL